MDIQTIIQTYLTDPKAQQDELDRIQRRATNIDQLRTITQRFMAQETSLEAFRTELEKALRDGEDWGAKGPGFLMNLNKLVKNHHNSSNDIETYFCNILNGLHASNLGPRIEQWHAFLLNERARLRQAGKGNIAMAAGNSAFFLSIFAAWLDTANQPDIYYLSLREGLYKLVEADIVPAPAGLNLNAHAIQVLTNADHMAFVQLIASITRHVPPEKLVPYWAESFGYWVNEYFKSSNPVIKESDNGEVLRRAPKHISEVRDASAPYSSDQFLKNDPLMPTPEPLLSHLIREVQRHILVEEPIIRRIYHALLAGHVILSGPPGTGKTELARLIPEILWQRPEHEGDDDNPEEVTLTRNTAYTTTLVTATDEWSVRTLISGIAPVSKNGSVSYRVKYGYLTSTILNNWSAQGNGPEKWETLILRRSLVTSNSGIERGTPQTFRGQWLIIDEFNRAPIDLALGDALTALGGNDVLRVAIEGGSAELPIPKDFRIIGTLNSFDRHYLNQISEALKRRFSFVEILPPKRSLRTAEQAIVLYKALKSVSHLSKTIVSENEVMTWESSNMGSITIEVDPEGLYNITWAEGPSPFREAFETAWCLFEVIRIYRQLGTAQAISLIRHMLITGILQSYSTREEWIGQALDAALCDTIADQLQVLLPDEIDVLLLALTCQREAFSVAYNRLLSGLTDRQQRLYGQLLVLSRVSNESGETFLSDEEIEVIAQSHQPEVVPEKLVGLFHLSTPCYRLPQFIRRLHAFKAERGL